MASNVPSGPRGLDLQAMVMASTVVSGPRGLDFFVGCDAACQKIRDHISCGRGETAMRGLQCSVLRDIDFLHNMPLQTLNDRLKKYPFVDPSPFDELLTEMITAVLEWVQWVTDPDWIVEMLHGVAAATAGHQSVANEPARVNPSFAAPGIGVETQPTLKLREDIDELEECAKFVYPLPLKLRDLQAMIRPFMEVRSHHHIFGLDAIVSELIRDLLRLYHTIKAWDEALVEHMRRIVDAIVGEKSKSESHHPLHAAISELCARMDMDIFEASHRLHHFSNEQLAMTQGDIEIICQKLPIYHDKFLLRGQPVASFSRTLHNLDKINRSRTGERLDESGAHFFGGKNDFEDLRLEALMWWREQRFSSGIATGVFASTLLTFFVDAGLHPDPHVAAKLPLVLERLFGNHLSCRSFMNRLLPTLGDYVASSGQQIPLGHGFPIKRDVVACAESTLIFLRHWYDIVGNPTLTETGETDGNGVKNTMQRTISAKTGNERVNVCSVGGRHVKRASDFNMDKFVEDLTGPKHSVHEVVRLLEGATPIPDHVLNVPVEEKRYRVDEGSERLWEHTTNQYLDLLETLDLHHRDLGPYVFMDLESADDDQQQKRRAAHRTQTQGILLNPTIAKAAKEGYDMNESDSDDDDRKEGPNAATLGLLSDTFGLRLVEWPVDAVGTGTSSTSTFVRYFCERGRIVSRGWLQGLPALPWSLGADERNSVIVDIPGVAAFHCLFTQAKAQPNRPCIVALGGSLLPTYIVCPKYQPIQVQNGDRLVCHQWNFELRILPTGLHMSALQILTDEGDIYEVPTEGCHVGAGNRSRQIPNQPKFPQAKFALKHRLKDMSAVHLVLLYHAPTNRWTLVDHSPDPLGTLLLCKTSQAYPLSHGMRVKMGPVILETVLNK